MFPQFKQSVSVVAVTERQAWVAQILTGVVVVPEERTLRPQAFLCHQEILYIIRLVAQARKLGSGKPQMGHRLQQLMAA